MMTWPQTFAQLFFIAAYRSASNNGA
jgi:hypothetical protein